jgi:hypothetical protein
MVAMVSTAIRNAAWKSVTSGRQTSTSQVSDHVLTRRATSHETATTTNERQVEKNMEKTRACQLRERNVL